MVHPVQLQFAPGLERSRLHTFFNGLLALPHLVVLGLYGMVAGVAIFVSWVMTVATGRNPQGLHDFVAGYLTYSVRVSAYMLLLVRAYPVFPGGAAAHDVQVAIPAPVEQGRLLALFRTIAVIPALVVAWFFVLVAYLTTVIAWFAILFTGTTTENLQVYGEKTLQYVARINAYMYFLTPAWPKAQDDLDAAEQLGRQSSTATPVS